MARRPIDTAAIKAASRISQPKPATGGPDAVLFWNNVLLEVHRRDFTFDDLAGDDESDAPIDRQALSPEQGGPTRTSRAFTMVHLAMYDAAWAYDNAIGESYLDAKTGKKPDAPPTGSSVKAAIGGAAAAAIQGLWKNDGRFIAAKLAEWTGLLAAAEVPALAIAQGFACGERIAESILAHRDKDGSEKADLYVPLGVPGTHRPDPFAPSQPYLGANWGHVKSFAFDVADIKDAINLKAPLGQAQPGSYTSVGKAWADQRDEVRKKGGIPGTPGFNRTPEETVIGVFWGYDGARGLGVPPRLYNQCLHAISGQAGLDEKQNAVLFALCNMAMADGGIATWRSKYLFHVARPVIGIREADAGYGPASGHSAPTLPGLAMPVPVPSSGWLTTSPAAGTVMNGDPFWAPLGAPQTNATDVSRTPPFPAYPSGHATFGAACFGMAHEVLSAYGKPTQAAFELVSDELDGRNKDADGSTRARHNRKLTLAQAIHENAVSRIYLGVHWRMDAEEGVDVGAQVVQLIKAQKKGPAKLFDKPRSA